MISRYNNFQLDLLLEKIINESYIYFSPDLEKVLRRTKSEIGNDLLSISKTNIKPDVTFVNIDQGKEDYLSFTTARNAGNNLSKIWTHVKPDDWFTSVLNGGDLDDIWGKRGDVNDVYSKSRNSLRIGRFVNKVFPGKYTDKQIEEFVNAFKASIESKERFEIVEGEDIVKWYNYRNYLEVKGTLGNSCMRDKSSSTFRMYVSNPEVCRMLILRSDDDGEKIIGRALIWKLESIRRFGKELEGVEYFMDRQYTINDSDVVKFKNYAKEQGWAYKAHNNHHSFEPIFYKDEEFNAKMKIQLVVKYGGDFDYSRYPYMDTFRRYDPESGMLFNDDEDDSSYSGCYILDSTDGSYTEIEGGVWSDYHDRRIPEDESVWSDYENTYILRDRAVEVYNGSYRYHGWYPENNDCLVFDEYDEFYIREEDSVYSEHYGYSILADNSIEVVYEIDSDGDIDTVDIYHKRDDGYVSIDSKLTWYDKLSSRFRRWLDLEYINSKLVITNYNGDYIPKIFSIDVYEVADPINDESIDITGIDFLTKFDAEILGYEIKEGTNKIIDQFEYHKTIEPILNSLYKNLIIESKRLKNQLNKEGQLTIKFDEFGDSDDLNIKDKLNLYFNRIEEIENGEYIDFESK